MRKERIKGLIAGVVVALLITTTVPALAASVTSAIQVTYRNIRLVVDGRTITTQQEPFIFEGRTYVALRDVAEAFGAQARFNEITDTIEITSRQNTQPTPPQTQTPSVPAGAATNRNERPDNPTITRERAIEIAVAWLSANGITNARRDGGVSMDFERGRWVWEVEYQQGRQEWDFYICVMTGEVVHVDIDWD